MTLKEKPLVIENTEDLYYKDILNTGTEKIKAWIDEDQTKATVDLRVNHLNRLRINVALNRDGEIKGLADGEIKIWDNLFGKKLLFIYEQADIPGVASLAKIEKFRQEGITAEYIPVGSMENFLIKTAMRPKLGLPSSINVVETAFDYVENGHNKTPEDIAKSLVIAA